LYNFALYTEWPISPDSFEFCLVGAAGTNGVRQAADALSRRTITGRTIRVRFADFGDELSTCHLALLPAASPQQVAPALARLQGEPVLTIVDGDGEVGEAAILRLMRRNERLVFEANLTAARAVGLSLSSKMLRLARAVR
ncbi:MAG TPA: YfiR family protein, partial [Rhodocyclaceae bacterium]